MPTSADGHHRRGHPERRRLAGQQHQRAGPDGRRSRSTNHFDRPRLGDEVLNARASAPAPSRDRRSRARSGTPRSCRASRAPVPTASRRWRERRTRRHARRKRRSGRAPYPASAAPARLAKDSTAIRVLSSSCRRLRPRKIPITSRPYRAVVARPRTAAIDNTTLNPDASQIARIPPTTATAMASAPAAKCHIALPVVDIGRRA